MADIKDTTASAPYIRVSDPAIRIKFGTEMAINRKVLYALGSPRHIHFWWSESHRVLLIGAIAEETPLSFRVRERFYTARTGFKIENRPFLREIMRIAGWHKDMICAVKGTFIPELGMVAFKLDEADEMEIVADV